MTLTPTDLDMILAFLTNGEGLIRPGKWTGEQKMELVAKVQQMKKYRTPQSEGSEK